MDAAFYDHFSATSNDDNVNKDIREETEEELMMMNQSESSKVSSTVLHRVRNQKALPHKSRELRSSVLCVLAAEHAWRKGHVEEARTSLNAFWLEEPPLNQVGISLFIIINIFISLSFIVLLSS